MKLPDVYRRWHGRSSGSGNRGARYAALDIEAKP